MIKEKKPLFLKVIWIIGFIFLANIAIFLFYYSKSSGFTGMSINKITESISNLSFSTKIFILTEWTMLLLMLLFFYLKDRKIKKDSFSKLDLKKMSNGSKTDLDTLYNILKEKKQISILNISQIFKIKEELALEWCKTLEEANLANIEYPGMGKPVLKII